MKPTLKNLPTFPFSLRVFFSISQNSYRHGLARRESWFIPLKGSVDYRLAELKSWEAPSFSYGMAGGLEVMASLFAPCRERCIRKAAECLSAHRNLVVHKKQRGEKLKGNGFLDEAAFWRREAFNAERAAA